MLVSFTMAVVWFSLKYIVVQVLIWLVDTSPAKGTNVYWLISVNTADWAIVHWDFTVHCSELVYKEWFIGDILLTQVSTRFYYFDCQEFGGQFPSSPIIMILTDWFMVWIWRGKIYLSSPLFVPHLVNLTPIFNTNIVTGP